VKKRLAGWLDKEKEPNRKLIKPQNLKIYNLIPPCQGGEKMQKREEIQKRKYVPPRIVIMPSCTALNSDISLVW